MGLASLETEAREGQTALASLVQSASQQADTAVQLAQHQAETLVGLEEKVEQADSRQVETVARMKEVSRILHIAPDCCSAVTTGDPAGGRAGWPGGRAGGRAGGRPGRAAASPAGDHGEVSEDFCWIITHHIGIELSLLWCSGWSS